MGVDVPRGAGPTRTAAVVFAHVEMGALEADVFKSLSIRTDSGAGTASFLAPLFFASFGGNARELSIEAREEKNRGRSTEVP